jgi:four helix bundle protein
VSQLQRASLSIAANIAEGASRGSDKDFANFLQIAIGSTTEVEYHLEFAADARIISRFVKYLRNQSKPSAPLAPLAP